MSTTEDADERVRALRDCVDLVVDHGDPRVTEILGETLSLAFQLSRLETVDPEFAPTHGKIMNKLHTLRRCWTDQMKCDPTEFPRALAVFGTQGTSPQFIQKEAAKCAKEFETLFFHILALSQTKPAARGSVH